MNLQDWLALDFMGLMSHDFIALLNIAMIDLVLAGDNAIVVGMAASRVAPQIRARVIFWGMVGAVALRIIFAVLTTHLLAITGLTLAGGILLLWVCWKMYREIATHISNANEMMSNDDGTMVAAQTVGFGSALLHIIVADVSMSLDNVLAVAGAAKGNVTVLVLGLGIAILAMAIAANYIAKLLGKYPWITWIGLLIILYVAMDMIWRGSHEVACQTYGGYWCNHSLFDVVKSKAAMWPSLRH